MELRGAHEVGGAPSTLVTASFVPWSMVQVSWIMFGEKITGGPGRVALDWEGLELRNRPQGGISWIQKVAAVELGFWLRI